MKKKIFLVIVLTFGLFVLCGCANVCVNCDSEIEKDKAVEVSGDKYCENCIEYCVKCETPCVKENGFVFMHKDNYYCETCFEQEAYPIVLEDNENVNISITGYDDSEGVFSVTIENKTNYKISVFERNESVLLDGKNRCISETDGTWSFAYADVPANETITVFSTFRKSGDEWDTILKLSEGHTFEFVQTAWINDDNFNDFWDTDFKVVLTPAMFGYIK